MFLFAIAITSKPEAYLHAFLNQPIDVALLEVILLVGWIPIAAILLEGLMEIWKDYRQGIFQGRLQYIVLAIDVPKMTEQSPKAVENIFVTLQGTFSTLLWKEIWFMGKMQPRFSFEIASIDGYIQYYVRCEERFRDLVEAAIYAQYPDAQIAEVEDYAQIVPGRYPDPEWDMWGTEFVLKKDQYLPVRTWPMFEHGLSQELKDPLSALLEQMSRMRPGECFFFQILLGLSEQKKWKEQGRKFIKKTYGLKDDAKGNGFLDQLMSWPGGFVNEVTGVDVNAMFGLEGGASDKPEDPWRAFKITLEEKAQVEGVLNKISHLGFETKIRIAYFAKKGVYSKGQRVPMIKGFLSPFNNHGSQEFGMYSPQIPKNDYFWQRWTYTHRQSRVAQAFKKRSFSLGAAPKILCTEELATIWHFPTITIKAPLIKKTESRRAEPPVSLPIAGEDVPLYRTPPVTPTKKEAPPIGLATSPTLEPEISFAAPIEPNRIQKTKSQPTAVASNVQKNVPDVMRVLFEPGVELEDVKLPPAPNEATEGMEEEDKIIPPNLPL
ncbi:MAG: hypothetical protein WC702_01005 [Patescibacteria group bacterium]|jgi:hypothetical protein